MTKILLIPALALLLGACGAPFTAEQDPIGIGQAGEAPASAGAGAVLEAGSAGQAAAGATSGGSASQAGAPSAGAAGAPAMAGVPCSPAVDTTSPGFLSLGGDTCYRTKETFDTITCGGSSWDKRTIKVNGAMAECNKMQVFAPAIDGYNYFDIEGAPPGTDWLRWSTAGKTSSCWPIWAHDQCTKYQVGDVVSNNGHNWICNTPECTLCATNGSCAPSGKCPDGDVWLDEGACR